MSRFANPTQDPGLGVETKPQERQSRVVLADLGFPMVIAWSLLVATGAFTLAGLLRSPMAGSDRGWALATLAGLLSVAFSYVAGRSIGYVRGYRVAWTESVGESHRGEGSLHVDPSEITSLIQLIIALEKRQLRSRSEPTAESDEVYDDDEGFERDLDYALERNAELMRRLAR